MIDFAGGNEDVRRGPMRPALHLSIASLNTPSNRCTDKCKLS